MLMSRPPDANSLCQGSEPSDQKMSSSSSFFLEESYRPPNLTGLRRSWIAMPKIREIGAKSESPDGSSRPESRSDGRTRRAPARSLSRNSILNGAFASELSKSFVNMLRPGSFSEIPPPLDYDASDDSPHSLRMYTAEFVDTDISAVALALGTPDSNAKATSANSNGQRQTRNIQCYARASDNYAGSDDKVNDDDDGDDIASSSCELVDSNCDDDNDGIRDTQTKSAGTTTTNTAFVPRRMSSVYGKWLSYCAKAITAVPSSTTTTRPFHQSDIPTSRQKFVKSSSSADSIISLIRLPPRMMKRNSDLTDDRLHRQFTGPLCAIYPSGVITCPSRCDPSSWEAAMGANGGLYPRHPAENSGVLPLYYVNPS